MTIDGRVAVAGDVSLILADGAMLVVDGGIDVPAGAGFTIYAQSDGDNQGILEAYGEEFSGEGSAGIGGNEEDVNFGDIVICGGLISQRAARAQLVLAAAGSTSTTMWSTALSRS